MNLTPENRKKLTKWLIGIAAACILIFLGLQNISAVADALGWLIGIAMPLLVGWGIAIIVNVPMRFLETHLWSKSKKPFLTKIRRPVALILSLVFILGVLAGVVIVVLPTLIDTITVFVESAIEIVGKLNSENKEDIAALPFGELLLEINWSELVNSLKNWLQERSHAIVDTAFGTVTSAVGIIIDMFLSIAFAIYLLGSKETLKRQLTRVVRAWFPEKKAGWLIHAAEILNVNFRSFIAGQSLEAVILGILCFVGMLIFGFPYAAMISTMVGVTQLIPIIGGFIGGGIGALMILTLDPMKALWFVIYLIVLQILENNLIYPKVMGTQVHLSSLIILAAVTLGGGVAGPVGILLAVPVASTAYTLLKEATAKREQMMLRTAEPTCPEAAAEPTPEPTATPEPEKKPEPTAQKPKKKTKKSK